MKESLKNAFVFVGTVIGAGFATGQEIKLYFGMSDVSVCIFAGMLMGILCTIFIMIGTKYNSGLLYKLSMFICSFISFIAMFSALKSIFSSYKYCFLISFAIVILSGVVVKFGIEKLKLVNSIAVPLIIVYVLFVFIKTSKCDYSGSLNFMNGVTYSGLNMIIASGVMMRLNVQNKKSSIMTGMFSAIIMSLLLVMILLIVCNESGEMPMLIVSERLGFLEASKFVIFLSVFTTMLSSMDTSVSIFYEVTKKKDLSIAILIILALPFVIMFSFENIIKYFYPILSILGLTLILSILSFYYLKKYLKIFDNKA